MMRRRHMPWRGATAARPSLRAAAETVAWSSGTSKRTSAPRRASGLKSPTRMDGQTEEVLAHSHRLTTAASCRRRREFASWPPLLPSMVWHGAKARNRQAQLPLAQPKRRRTRMAKSMDPRNRNHRTRSVATTRIQKRKIQRNIRKYGKKRRTKRTNYSIK